MSVPPDETVLGPLPTHRTPIEDSDQTARMHSLFLVFYGRKCQTYFVCLVGLRIYVQANSYGHVETVSSPTCKYTFP